MNNEKLTEIGDTLEITEEDIREIRKEKFRIKLIYPIVVAMEGIISIFSFVLGYNKGKDKSIKLVSADTGKVYPLSESKFSYYPALYYVIGGTVGLGSVIALSKSKHKKFLIASIIVALIASILAFKHGFNLTKPMIQYYHGEIFYGVYNKDKGNIYE